MKTHLDRWYGLAKQRCKIRKCSQSLKNSLIEHITKYITYYESKTIENASKYVVANYNKFKIKQKTIKVYRTRNFELKVLSFKVKSDLKLKLKDE